MVPDKPDELQFIMEREREMVKTVFYTPEYDSDIEELKEEEDDNVTQYEDALDEINVESKKIDQTHES